MAVVAMNAESGAEPIILSAIPVAAFAARGCTLQDPIEMALPTGNRTVLPLEREVGLVVFFDPASCAFFLLIHRNKIAH